MVYLGQNTSVGNTFLRHIGFADCQDICKQCRSEYPRLNSQAITVNQRYGFVLEAKAFDSFGNLIQLSYSRNIYCQFLRHQ